MPLAHAGMPTLCARESPFDIAQQDKRLRFGELLKAELERSGYSMALVARSGLNLARFGVRYSHAGLALQASPNGAWSVRQLYYACEESTPRIFDQGLAGFVVGTDDPRVGYVSVVFMPGESAQRLEAGALSNPQALALLGGHYSANAYAFSTQYQNCNQWIAELMASVWMGEASADVAATDSTSQASRARAQAWLRKQGYQPTEFEVYNPFVVGAAAFIPLLHFRDHPQALMQQGRYRVSMPAALENFVHAQVPGAERLELCHNERHVVIHRGWTPIAEGCEPGEGDTVVPLNP